MKLSKWINGIPSELLDKNYINCAYLQNLYNDVKSNIISKRGKHPQNLHKYLRNFIDVGILNDLGSTGDIANRCLQIWDGKNALTNSKMILMYGEIEGNIRWKSYCNKQSYTNTQEYKNMSDDEYKKYNKSRAVTLKNLILKYGEIEGNIRWKSYCDKQSYTNTLPHFIEKYGKILGKEKYAKVNFFKGHSSQSYISRFGEIDGLKRYISYSDKRKSFYSNMATNLFSKIEKKLNISNNIYYAPKSKEFGKYSTALKKYCKYDFVIPDLKLCIEFNGDVFHANPKLYNSNDEPNPYTNTKSKDIWEHDKLKNNVLIKCGYDIIIVWEHDYVGNEDYWINNLVNFIITRKNEMEEHD